MYVGTKLVVDTMLAGYVKLVKKGHKMNQITFLPSSDKSDGHLGVGLGVKTPFVSLGFQVNSILKPSPKKSLINKVVSFGLKSRNGKGKK